MEKIVSLIDIPDEIITLILLNSEPRDIIHFGATCKQFYELISFNDFLWKKKFSEIVKSEVIEVVSVRKHDNWLTEFSNFYDLKQKVSMELISMPLKNYRRVNELDVTDVDVFFTIATAGNLNYYYIIYILQDIVRTGYIVIDTQECIKPLYTLTTILYAKIVLRHLLHVYLAMKFLQKYARHELTPVFLTTFFLQWVDVTKSYSEEDVEKKIQLLVTTVEEVLKESNSKLQLKQQPLETKKYTEIEILHAITKVIYSNNRVCTSPSIDTLDIVKVIDEKKGNIISYGAIYQAVAKKFGLKCELIAFPNHLFLEWHSSDEPFKLYIIDLFNGQIKPKRRCPFSNGGECTYEYFPNSLLQFIYDSYIKYEGAIKNCNTQNAILLWDFIDIRNDGYRTRMNFLHFLRFEHSPAIEANIDLRYLEPEHLQLMMSVLCRIKGNVRYLDANKRLLIKKRHMSMKYTVGMICYHSMFNYLCVIRGWELNGNHLPLTEVEDVREKEQPFYSIVTENQTERYVAQENLRVAPEPCRLPYLEDILGKEFTHFDGFIYVPNDEKLIEYPDDEWSAYVCKRFSSNVE